MSGLADLASRLVAQATPRGLRVTVAESCTGGMVAAAITSVPGSSAILDYGFVTYSNGAKVDLLGVSPATLEAEGAVSEAVAVQMAVGALARSGADVAVSITGIAGPGGSEHKPEGRVCFARARAGRPVEVETREFGALGRAGVRAAAAARALEWLVDAAE